mmetsp:Transcript_8424/g.12837  ORF Transcript_8424/g.12837 Transcript_8424/m.12837 type:complete len:80 (-) Transcript_8424:872-1111(-)
MNLNTSSLPSLWLSLLSNSSDRLLQLKICLLADSEHRLHRILLTKVFLLQTLLQRREEEYLERLVPLAHLLAQDQPQVA